MGQTNTVPANKSGDYSGPKRATDEDIKNYVTRMVQQNKGSDADFASLSAKQMFTDNDRLQKLGQDLKNFDVNELTKDLKPLYNQYKDQIPASIKDKLPSTLTGGATKTFNSTRKRYLKYNINEPQNGGNWDHKQTAGNWDHKQTAGNWDHGKNTSGYSEISDLSEFYKIKEHLLRDTDNIDSFKFGNSENKPRTNSNNFNNFNLNQSGGHYDLPSKGNKENDEDFDNFSDIINSLKSPSSEKQKSKTNIFNLLKGGQRTEEEDSIEFDEDGDDEADIDEVEIEDDDEGDDTDLEGNEDDADLETIENETDTDDDGTQTQTQTQTETETSNDGKNYSDTSIHTDDLNIMPFYSSDNSSEQKHPYRKSRY